MNRYRFLFLFFLVFNFVFYNSWAQPAKILDSIKQVLQRTTSDSVKYRGYADLSWYYADTRTKLDSTRMYADSIKFLATVRNDERGIVLSHFYYGLADRYEGKFHEGIRHMEKGVAYHKERGDSTRVAIVLFQIAVMHENLGNYVESLAAYQRVLDIQKKNEFKPSIANTLLAMGHVQRNIDNYVAIKTYQEAIKLWEELGDKEGLSMTMEGIGNAYEELREFEKAESYLKRALEIVKSEKIDYGIATVLENLGSMYGRMGNYEKALECHLESLNIRDNLPSQRNLAQSLHKVGTTYAILGKSNLVKSYLLRSLDIAKKINNGLLLTENYKALTSFYESVNNKSEAFNYQKLYIAIKDSMVTAEKNKQLVELQTKYETAQKDQEITLLTKENEIQQANAEKESTLRSALIGGLFLLGIIAGLIFYTMRTRLKNQKLLAIKNEEIQMANLKEQLGTLEMKALRAQMNPHFLFNCMNSINRMIMEEENDKASKYLSKFSKLVRLLLENSENPKVNLKDELEMLKSYIELESIRFKNKMEYKINVSESIDQESTYIPSMVLQPFVENAIWHGLLHKDTKGQLIIDIKEEGDNLHCSITDNGVGREKSLKLQKQSGHKKISMGIKITTDRLKLLTKQKISEAIKILDLKDSENNAVGTQVNILIPIS